MAVLREDVFVVEPVRTPIGKFGGALASLSAVEIGTCAARATVARAGIAPEAVDELIFGNARQAGVGPNPARQIAFRSGFGERVPAYTVNQACGSGMRAIINAADAIRLGNAALLIAGGTESMSNTPYMLPRARWGLRMGDGEIVDGMLRDGFICPLAEEMMGATAETLAERYAIDRNEQDAYVVETQRRAAQAWSNGNFANEVIAVTVQGKKGDVVVDRDEHLRGDTTMESLAKLPPVFRPGGTVHAGNSSGITDGAAAMIVAGADAVKRHGLRPIARIVAYQQAAIDPKVMGLGPVPATRRLLEETGLTMDRIDLVELNEAFAAQLLACDRELALDRARLNVNGGAIALGHPIGCTGARIVTTLVHALAARKKSIGLATLCISGGMGMSMLFERC
jgi:acetyl-CoA C-acetyltransferase